MVASGYRFITKGLGVGHLRLVIGSSMGGMQCWMWAAMYPDLMAGVVALSCQPVEISGRNWRCAAAEAIRHDPDWNNGFYEQNPRHYIYSAATTTESPTRIQEMAPTLAAANALYAGLPRRRRAMPTTSSGRSRRSRTITPSPTSTRSQPRCC